MIDQLQTSWSKIWNILYLGSKTLPHALKLDLVQVLLPPIKQKGWKYYYKIEKNELNNIKVRKFKKRKKFWKYNILITLVQNSKK